MHLRPLKLFLKYLARGRYRLGARIPLGRAAGMITLAILVPNLTGLLGDISPTTALYWLGYEYSLGIALVIWLGNRFIWMQERKLRRHIPPHILKPGLFIAATLFYTVPITMLLCIGWFWVAAWQVQWEIVKDVVFCYVIVSCFVTFFYETVVLASRREDDLLRIEQLERATVQAELEALKLQLDPHFIFNSLNTLSHLIETQPQEALEFNDSLAEVYRYMLAHRTKTLVPLGDELAFLESYYTLLRLRFRDAVRLSVECGVQANDYAIMPLALQLLLENAVKHNELDKQTPLLVEVRIDADFVSLSNTRRPKRLLKTRTQQSSGTGLANLDERAKLITKQGIAVVESSEKFFVRIPLVRRSEQKTLQELHNERAVQLQLTNPQAPAV